MQTIVQVVCTKGLSLRDNVARDHRLSKYDLEVVSKKKSGRSPGWTKVRRLKAGAQGALNIQWDGSTAVLTCRVVNREAGRPKVVGDFRPIYLHTSHKWFPQESSQIVFESRIDNVNGSLYSAVAYHGIIREDKSIRRNPGTLVRERPLCCLCDSRQSGEDRLAHIV
jgi:hypothetical protein